MLAKLRNMLTGFKLKPAKPSLPKKRPSPARTQKAQRRRQPQTLLGAKGYALGYLNMPKAACTSVKNILYFLHNGSWYGDPLHIHKAIRYNAAVLCGESYLENRSKLMAAGRPWLNFTFVRDPGPRAYSAFVEKIWATGPYAFPGIRNYLIQQGLLTLSPLSPNEIPDKAIVAANFLAFLNFVAANLAGKTPFPGNAHWCVQSDRIRQLQGADKIGFVGRVETFARDMNHILREGGYTGVDLGNSRFNEGPKPPFSFKDITTPAITDQIKAIYENDYKEFSY